MKEFLRGALWGLIFVAFASLFIAPAWAEEQPRTEFADQLGKSVGHYGAAGGKGFCTATKIGPREWLTARHCVDFDTKIETSSGEYIWPRSITFTVAKKKDGGRREDWAILHVAQDTPDVPSLTLGCGDELHQGQGVAYFGFPAGVTKGYFEGYVSSVHKVAARGNAADFVIDIAVAGGASGSALVDRSTMRILGVITEGVYSSRTGFYLAAAESVRNIDECKVWLESQDKEGAVKRPFVRLLPEEADLPPGNDPVDWT